MADPTVLRHFTERAPRYNQSSHWVDDPALGAATVAALAPAAHHTLLDLACGTGLVSKHLRGKVAHITGLDITSAMFEQARPYIDRLVEGAGEALPFPDASFDRAVCRQGIQFMDDRAAVAELFRVLKPGGRVVLVHLCAYGPEDEAEYFEILRLRNYARRNFYRREDLHNLLAGAGFVDVQVGDWISAEDVDVWTDTGAIEEADRAAIRAIYRSASPAFSALHAAEVGDRIVDHMLFGIAVGTRPQP